jgi:uncharacterized membrane protein YphA (DoxX/SURF4 family)
MGAQHTIAHIEQTREIPRWSLATRIVFRFFFVYLGLYSLVTQVFGGLFPIPNVEIPDLGSLWPMRQIIFWTAAHVFRIRHPLVYSGSGSGDKTFDWIESFCLLVISALITAIWSYLDRKRENYVTLHKWFRLFIRFALASELILYGMDKFVPLQMPFPYLTTLVEPYGNFSRMGVLWASIGSSTSYEIFAGCAELLGGILLIFPRTTTFGTLVCMADLTQVFMLNMTYDVPVKLFSFHLILMSYFLLVPEFSRLANFFFLRRTVGPSAQPPLFRTPGANRIAFAAQVTFGIILVGMNAYGNWGGWHKYGGGSPKSALYGIWNVEQFSIDGQIRSPLLNDYDRYRRVIFDLSNFAAFQRMDDSFTAFGASIDANAKTITLTKRADKKWRATLTYVRPAQDRLILDGTLDNHIVHMQLQLFDRNKFMLVNRGFHWIQEYPFNH